MKGFAKLDRLPAGCALAIECSAAGPGHSVQCVQFQATGAEGNLSEWSGWFTYEGEPIVLYWDAFWVTP